MFNATFIKYGQDVWHDGELVKIPKQPIDFFGRKTEKELAKNVLMDPNLRKPVIIFGERRFGKTSMMKLLLHSMDNKEKPGFAPVEIPWMGINSFDQLMREILNGIAMKFDLELNVIRTIEESCAGLGESTSLAIYKIDQLIKKADDKAKDKIIILGIDELDSIILGQLKNPDDKNKLIGFLNTIVEGSNLPLKLLLTMAVPPEKIESVRHSPFTSKAEPIKLKPFSLEETKEMVNDIMEAEYEIDVNRIYLLSGGWPFFIKLLLVYAGTRGKGKVDMDAVLKQAINDSNARQSIENIYSIHFNDEEKRVVLMLAKDGQLKADDFNKMKVSRKAATHDLINRHFVKINENGVYCFSIGYLKDWFPNWTKFDIQLEQMFKEENKEGTCGEVIEITDEDLIKYT